MKDLIKGVVKDAKSKDPVELDAGIRLILLQQLYSLRDKVDSIYPEAMTSSESRLCTGMKSLIHQQELDVLHKE